MSNEPGVQASGSILKFRPDIEGLRAVAILLVVAAHAGVPWLQGGFVGVDVFFVISGFLITGLLLQEFRSTGSIGFISFYARRLRRLLPALLVVLAATAAGAMALLAPMEQANQAGSGAYASVWLSNVFFSRNKLDYFEPQAANDLFLHTWSLGVEEQYYLLWPALLLFALGGWRWQSRRTTPGSAALLALVLAFVLSLADCLLLARSNSVAAFYLLPPRVWEFALGALAYVLSAQRGTLAPLDGAWHGWLRPRLARWFGWCGLAAILGAACLLDAASAWPGANTLLPTFGTAAVLLAGSANAGIGAGRVLSARVPNFLGRVSYGWYLWHWPVLMLGAALFPDRGALVMAALAVLSLLLAWGSLHLVERPVRNSAWLAGRPGATLAGGLALMLLAWMAMQAWKAQAGAWAGQGAQGRYTQVRATRSAIYAAGCDEWYFSDRLRPCVSGNESAARHVVLIGDSVGLQWHDALIAAFPAPRWRVTVLTKSSCPMVDSAFVYPRIGRRYFECERWRNAALDYIAAIRPDVVVMGSSAEYGFTGREWEAGTKTVVGRIAATTGQVVVLSPTPVLTFDPLVCLARRDWRPPALSARMACAEPLGDPRSRQIAAWLRRGVAGFDNARVAGFDDLVCPGGTCAGERDGVVVYRDPQHLSAEFVQRHSSAFAAQLARAMDAPAPPP